MVMALGVSSDKIQVFSLNRGNVDVHQRRSDCVRIKTSIKQQGLCRGAQCISVIADSYGVALVDG